LEKNDNFGRTITLKLKTKEFQIITRSFSKEHYILQLEEIEQIATELLDKNKEVFSEIRLIGLSSSNLQKEKPDLQGGQIAFDF
jgi:DNA polymerase-4